MTCADNCSSCSHDCTVVAAASERASGWGCGGKGCHRSTLPPLPTYLPTYLYPSFPFAPLIKFKCIYLAASAHTRAVDEIMVDCTLHSALCTGTTRRAGTPARQRLRRVIVAHDRRRSRRSEKIANVDARRAIIYSDNASINGDNGISK